mgnify:CR=1 FL=1
MKRFLIKFCILFLLIDGYITIYHFYITPRITGGMGHLGQITFDKEYYKRVQNTYPIHKSHVIHTQNIDSILSIEVDNKVKRIFTIGDSFSQQKQYGYSQFLGDQLSVDIYNIRRRTKDISPVDMFIRLVNRKEIPAQSIVVFESVERSYIDRFKDINLYDTARVDFAEIEKPKPQILNDAIQYITKALGKHQPIHRYILVADLFSHNNRQRTLYIYDSPWDKDGDFRFTEKYSGEDRIIANTNLYSLHDFAEAHNIFMIFVIAADKYDVYEPFIVSGYRPHNPTLDSLPEEPWIINTKPLLQNEVAKGVKDVYYINDTHWSPVGAKIVGEEIATRINN